MSVIIKGNNVNNSNDNGVKPSEVTNIKASQNASSIILSWTNPSNVVLNGVTLSIFDHVIIVRNTTRSPNSEKDGTVIYNGNGTTYTDSSVTRNTKYYYRFFTYDTNKKSNNSMDMIIESIFYGIDPILRNNTWEQINAASEAGIASSIWNIGDEIDLTLSGNVNQTVTLQIWDFNHFDKSDGTGKAGIVFGMKNLMKDKQQMNSSNTNSGGWNDTDMKKTVIQNILKSMPSDLQNVIKEVNTYANQGGSSSSDSIGLLSTDKVFLPGFVELYGTNTVWTSQSNTEKNQKQFPIFTDDNSRIKKLSNGSGDAYYWWTRSPYYYSGYYFCYVFSDGGENCDQVNNYDGVCFCFNI